MAKSPVPTATPHARHYRFVQVDVFTDRLFGGNPLAVFLDAASLSDAEMQAIAREMNLSETTFVVPPVHAGSAARVRIFTPARELPFAGHPTIGTGYVLATHALLPAGATEITLDEMVGPIAVQLEGDPANPRFLWMHHRDATFGPPLDNPAAFARALGLVPSDLLPNAPVQVGSTGTPFLYVPLGTREAVDQASLDVPALLACCADPDAVGVFIFAPDPDLASGRVYARMFAPHTLGIPEDPATGSAHGPLGAYLVKEGLVRQSDAVTIVSEQGTRMGRPSFLHVRLRVQNGAATDIWVGGSVVPVLEGTLHLP